MNLIDLLFAVILGLSFIIGMWRGLVYEVLSLFVWIVAFVLAQLFAPEVATKLPMPDAAQSLRYAAAFGLVFVGTAFAAGMLARLVRRMVAAVGLRPVDRTLGGVFGFFRGFILLLAIAVVANMTAMRSQADWQASQGASQLTLLLSQIKPLLPQDFAKYLP